VLSKEEGGRHTPFFSGYKPQFYFRTTDVTGSITLPEGVEMCMPGDNVKVTVNLMDNMPVAMDEGLRFAIREGGRTVGSGVVTKILALVDCMRYSQKWPRHKLKPSVTGADKAKLAGAGLLVIGALAAFYLLASQGPLAQWGALVVGLGAGGRSCFSRPSPASELFAFGRDAWREVKKVVWPARKEALQTTAYRVWLCRADGLVSVVDRQDAGVGVVRPGSWAGDGDERRL
jgi:hypothetical protein